MKRAIIIAAMLAAAGLAGAQMFAQLFGATPIPAWDAVPYSFEKFLPALNRFVGAASTDTATTFGNLSGTGKWYGGVLAPNGCIYGIPVNSTSILKIDPTTDTATTFGNLSGTSKWVGGVLAPNGCIYGIPYNSTSILKIDVGIPESLPLNALLSAFLNKF